MQGSIYGVCIGRISDQVILCSICLYKDEPSYINELKDAFGRLLATDRIKNMPKANVQGQVLGGVNVAFCYVVHDGFIYTVYVSETPQYPTRLAFRFLEDLEAGVIVAHSPEHRNVKCGKNGLKKTVKRLFESKSRLGALAKYLHPETLDKVAKAQAEVDATKDVVTNNVEILLRNSDNLEELSEKSKLLKNEAKIFGKQTRDLKGAMAWRSRMICLIITAIFAVILLIVFLFFLAIIVGVLIATGAASYMFYVALLLLYFVKEGSEDGQGNASSFESSVRPSEVMNM
jgi:hypothetical protein